MSERDGGPAYPMPTGYAPQTNVNEWNKASFGMSLRDYFAAAAMQGWLASLAENQAPNIGHTATWAYDMADAMLAERAK